MDPSKPATDAPEPLDPMDLRVVSQEELTKLNDDIKRESMQLLLRKLQDNPPKIDR